MTAGRRGILRTAEMSMVVKEAEALLLKKVLILDIGAFAQVPIPVQMLSINTSIGVTLVRTHQLLLLWNK